jgi:hypothetical protein
MKSKTLILFVLGIATVILAIGTAGMVLSPREHPHSSKPPGHPPLIRSMDAKAPASDFRADPLRARSAAIWPVANQPLPPDRYVNRDGRGRVLCLSNNCASDRIGTLFVMETKETVSVTGRQLERLMVRNTAYRCEKCNLDWVERYDPLWADMAIRSGSIPPPPSLPPGISIEMLSLPDMWEILQVLEANAGPLAGRYKEVTDRR